MTIQDTIAKYPALQNLQEQMDRLRTALKTKHGYDGDGSLDDMLTFVSDMSISIDGILNNFTVYTDDDGNTTTMGEYIVNGEPFSEVMTDIIESNKTLLDADITDQLGANAFEGSTLMYLNPDKVNMTSTISLQACFYNSPLLFGVGRIDTDASGNETYVPVVLRTTTAQSLFAGCSGLKFAVVSLPTLGSSNTVYNQTFANCKNLERIVFVDCKVGGAVSNDQTLNFVGNCTSLKRIENVSIARPFSTSTLTNLEYISLSEKTTRYGVIYSIVSYLPTGSGTQVIEIGYWDSLSEDEQTELTTIINEKNWIRNEFDATKYAD